ncbi:Na(+)-translocating NADH-quinone reductase subunit F [subsurface metagenome]
MDHSAKYKINIVSHNKTITAHEEDLLADKIQKAGINLSVYCNKKGLCGKCFVEIVKGKLAHLSEREELFIKQKRLDKNYRLACLHKIKSDLEINIPEESIIQEAFILKTGIKSLILINPVVKKYHLQLKKPEIGFPYSLSELLEKYFRKKKLVIPLNLLKELTDILERSKFQISATMYNESEILSIEPNDTLSKNFGIAIDIGTTTVVVELVDLNTGESIDSSTANNSQAKYGSDVVSRISFALLDSKNLTKLKNSILKTLNEMISQILDRNKIDNLYVYEIVIAGNTSMNHFLLGMPVKTLAFSPFHSVFARLPELSSNNLGFRINKYGKVYFSPNIKSFVGGDISAGLIASDLANKKGNYLFIDLGTNGEIVLKTDEKLIATSTAAGPAFEGMNISCGMVASPGAIYKAEYKNQLVLYTIKNKSALGVCGTGLIDLIAIFLDEGQITPKGKIENKTKKIQIADNIYITQKDVREMQLAIAAIKSGIKMILLKNNLKLEKLDGIFIAGAFGNYLNIKNSMRIGLLPQINEDKVNFIGNSSIAGAKVLLLSKPARKKIESLVKKIQYFSLATDQLFQKYFIEALEFKN